MKKVYLTFDDGPDLYTNEVLDLLKKHNIKATFFNLGSQEEKFPSLVKRLTSEGHSVGNHTWTHDLDLYKNEEKFIEEVKEVHKFQEDILGKEPEKIFRFPSGSDKVPEDFKKALIKEGYNFVDWDIYIQDGSRNPSVQKVVDIVKDGIIEHSDSPVILMHLERPEKTGPREALEKVILFLKEQNYEFFPIHQDDQLVRF